VVVAGAVLVPVLLSEPSAPCGRGMTAVGAAGTCVGLDIDSTGFTADGPLTELGRRIAESNDAVDGTFATIVLLDNMTPDAAQDSDDGEALRHRVQGALTAVQRANTQSVAGGTEPRIKLLLASYGSRAESWRQAVTAIRNARVAERIAAVIGIGQSLDTTRHAIIGLSEAGLATVGSVVTADDMNTDFDGEPIVDFFRVAPTNTDEAQAMVSYLIEHRKRRVMLVHDLNEGDGYTRTLSSAFVSAYESRTRNRIMYTDPYRSPGQALKGAVRREHMENRFARMLTNVCVNRPDVIVFAGRSADLASFMRALSEGGACGLPTLDVVTGDDAANIAGDPLPASGHLRFRVFYTALAHGAQWAEQPPDSVYRRNYDAFTEVFLRLGFGSVDLADGHAMISHDAALTAITAIRLDPLATTDPGTLSDSLLGIGCTNAVPGASGVIALRPDGNPVNKVMPILEIRQDGLLEQEGLVWPEGAEPDPGSCHS
jgi:ABC-type branched-subunit amino acid transport system substrate-binding protein